MPLKGVQLDGGGFYTPSKFQQYLGARWAEFWDEWVPHVTRGEAYELVVNGDAIDGVHHNSTTQVSHNLADQALIAYELLKPVVERAKTYYHVRGTEAHAGKSGADEERLAKSLGAIPDKDGNYARWELWLTIGRPAKRIHFTHHISTSGSSMAELGAVAREMVEMQVNNGRWGGFETDVLVRSHRHKYAEARMWTERGLQISVVTPGWQGKTPFVHKISGRISPSQFGGLLIRVDDAGLYTRARVWTP